MVHELRVYTSRGRKAMDVIHTSECPGRMVAESPDSWHFEYTCAFGGRISDLPATKRLPWTVLPEGRYEAVASGDVLALVVPLDTTSTKIFEAAAEAGTPVRTVLITGTGVAELTW